MLTYPTREAAIEAAIMDVVRDGEGRVVIHQACCQIENSDGTSDRSTCTCTPLTLIFGARA